jgi:hypothetical protein
VVERVWKEYRALEPEQRYLEIFAKRIEPVEIRLFIHVDRAGVRCRYSGLFSPTLKKPELGCQRQEDGLLLSLSFG